MEHLTELEVAQCADALVQGKYDALPQVLKEHLSSCDACAGEVAIVAELSGEIEKPAINQNVTAKHRKLWIAVLGGVAAVLLAIVLIGNYYEGTFLNFGRQTAHLSDIPSPQQKPDRTGITTTQEENLKPVDNDKIVSQQRTAQQESLLAYRPDDELEKLARNFEGVYRGNEISIVTPHEFNCSPKDLLQWNNPDKLMLSVEFYNNKGAIVSTQQTSAESLPIPSLTPGLYYWKLINDHFDLLFCGKLVVR